MYTASDYECALLKECTHERFDVNTTSIIMGECEHESGKFKRLIESFLYSAEVLLRTFPARIPTLAFAISLLHEGEEATANYLYGNRLGNGAKESGDGWRYRGRGVLQITGRENYMLAMRSLGIPLIGTPDAALVPENSAMIAVDYFMRKPFLMKAAARRDVLECSSWINLGHYKPGMREIPNGINEREVAVASWFQKLKN